MNIFSDRSPGRAEAPEPGLNKPAATCAPSSLTAWCKPGLTRVSMAAKALPQQHETAPPLASVQLSDAAPADLQAGIQDLPHEILCQIFDYLPLSIHGQCALVCRHWHASLPTTRQRIARWLESLSPLQRLRIPPLAVGYSSRTGPFLARQRHKLFPAMQTQHQQLVRLQTARQQPDLTPGTQQLLRHKEQTACGLLSGLIGYSLQHHRFQEGQLSLKPVSWHPPPSEPVLTVDRSPCSRWLATRYQRDPGDPGIAAALRLYGWRDGGWHEETLVGAPVYPVTCTAFAERMLDTLFTMQGSEVFVWRLAATSGHWYAEKLYSVPSSFQPYKLVVSDEDDLIGLSRREGRAPGFHVQISICRADLQCWEHAPPQQYTRV
ncbi:MAG: F-box protein, partial [Kistimonas sp.]|nr:F-box protein [Kistimonas sp.]